MKLKFKLMKTVIKYMRFIIGIGKKMNKIGKNEVKLLTVMPLSI